MNKDTLKSNSNRLFTRRDDVVWFVVPKAASRTIHFYFEKLNFKFEMECEKTEPDDLQKCFSFAFVRNPYERILSCYIQKIIEQKPTTDQHRNGMRWELNYQKPTFKEFVKLVLSDENITKDRHWNTIHNLIPVNDISYIGKIENIQNDLDHIKNEIGLTGWPWLPKRNSSKHDHYTTYYDQQTKDMVNNAYTLDIEHFGYEFGE